jgi:hypothetical protein
MEIKTLKATKHNGWNFGINYTIGKYGKHISVMFYKWTWTFLFK